MVLAGITTAEGRALSRTVRRLFRVQRWIGVGCVVVFLGVGIGAAAQGAENPGARRDQRHSVPVFPVGEYDSSWMVLDRSGNGSIDYAIKLDRNLEKVMEAVDHDNNGFMDDFYFYNEDSVFIRQEIDTNGNQAIDLWIHIEDGVYVRKWERDTNHDGTPDLVKEYAR
jgi:hypothetical protein